MHGWPSHGPWGLGPHRVVQADIKTPLARSPEQRSAGAPGRSRRHCLKGGRKGLVQDDSGNHVLSSSGGRIRRTLQAQRTRAAEERSSAQRRVLLDTPQRGPSVASGPPRAWHHQGRTGRFQRGYEEPVRQPTSPGCVTSVTHLVLSTR
ncbi:hypothetical protein VULLAG_LOCUS176 [Vulpes lagopus]